MVKEKKKQFLFNYTGNKFTESQNIETDFTKYTKIVECFGGSFGFSRYLYINDKVNPDVSFDIYDIDEDMIEFFITAFGGRTICFTSKQVSHSTNSITSMLFSCLNCLTHRS